MMLGSIGSVVLMVRCVLVSRSDWKRSCKQSAASDGKHIGE